MRHNPSGPPLHYLRPEPLISLVPLDDIARDGGYHLLGDGQQLAVGRWQDGGWHYSSGRPLGFVPVGYRGAVCG